MSCNFYPASGCARNICPGQKMLLLDHPYITRVGIRAEVTGKKHISIHLVYVFHFIHLIIYASEGVHKFLNIKKQHLTLHKITFDIKKVIKIWNHYRQRGWRVPHKYGNHFELSFHEGVGGGKPN